MKPNPVPRLFKKDTIRFLKTVARFGANDCWEWSAGRDRLGYGVFYFRNERHRAHRVAWIVIGNHQIKDGLNILHKCDNRACCNPHHLYQGTHGQNMRDMARRRRGTCGTKSWTAKLDNEKVLEIRRSFIPLTGSVAILAKRFKVGKTTIRNVIRGDSWAHIP
jgi:hypothetical protein